MRIHATAIVHPHARLEDNVCIGAYAIIHANVVIGDGCEIGPHVVIEEHTQLEIGERNVIREFVTVHRGTAKDHGVTRIGNDNLLMVYAHVAHDCLIGNQVIMANAATLAGHVTVGDCVNIAGLSAIHQFVRVGSYAMLGGGTIATLDIPPFMLAAGNHARLYGLNRRGLRRHGFDSDTIDQLQQTYRLLFRSGKRLTDAIVSVEAAGFASPQVSHLLAFLRHSQRGVTR
jgi:UDP-N-acetylglucosamine acyltransferase